MNKFKTLIILILITAVIFGAAALLRSSEDISRWLLDLSKNGAFFLPLIIVAAFIDSINPCAISVLFLTIAFFFSLGTARSGILKLGGVYILGVFLIYMLIGLGVLKTFDIFGVPHFMAKFGAAILIIFGAINLINEFFPSFPVKLRIPSASKETIAKLMHKASLPAVFLLGGLVGIFEFPCTGGPYLMVLGLLHDKSSFLSGLAYLIQFDFCLAFNHYSFNCPRRKFIIKSASMEIGKHRKNETLGRINRDCFGNYYFSVIIKLATSNK